jgi:hypothetical protein
MKEKTSTVSGAAAIVTMVLSVLLSAVFATIDITAARYADPGVTLEIADADGTECSGPDLVITSVESRTIAAGENEKYTVYIKNIGETRAIMDYPYIAGWQAYLSKNGVRRDMRLNSKNISGTLEAGQTTVSSSTVSADIVSRFPYLILELYVLSNVGECNSTNNTFVFTSTQQ